MALSAVFFLWADAAFFFSGPVPSSWADLVIPFFLARWATSIFYVFWPDPSLFCLGQPGPFLFWAGLALLCVCDLDLSLSSCRGRGRPSSSSFLTCLKIVILLRCMGVVLSRHTLPYLNEPRPKGTPGGHQRTGTPNPTGNGPPLKMLDRAHKNATSRDTSSCNFTFQLHLSNSTFQLHVALGASLLLPSDQGPSFHLPTYFGLDSGECSAMQKQAVERARER